jgi:hypothetical protein
LLVTLFFNIICCDYIVLKRGEKLPYKIEKGSYKMQVYKLEYSDILFVKQTFWRTLLNILTEILKNKERYIVLVPESFMLDIENMERYGAISEELPFFKVASTLSDIEISKIKDILSIDRSTKLSVQEILNLQVRYLMQLVERGSNFDPSKRYTELSKQNVISTIIQRRRAILAVLKSSFIELCVHVEKPYRDKTEKSEYRDHYYTKDIDYRSKTDLSNSIDNYGDKIIFISNIKDSDIDKLIAGDLSIAPKNVVIFNNKYKGYTISDSNIYLVGGDKAIYANSKYKIDVVVEDINISDLPNVKRSPILFRDL